MSADNYHAGIVNMLETLPGCGDNNHKPSDGTSVDDGVQPAALALDKDVLLMKATSAALLQALNSSYNLLHKYHQRSTSALPQSKQ